MDRQTRRRSADGHTDEEHLLLLEASPLDVYVHQRSMLLQDIRKLDPVLIDLTLHKILREIEVLQVIISV